MSSSSDDYPFAGNEIEAVDVFRCFGIRGDDHVSLLQSKSKTMMMKMTSQPSIAVSVISKKTEFFCFHYISSITVSIFFHP